MSAKADFALRGRNPDVLTCIANLSNDEVFTPPALANRMLDTLTEAWAADNGGANIWADSTVRFLDPCTKSGVFLREIASRLTEGLAEEMPNLEARVNHIMTQQVFGIGITQLTALLARRSLYCSKHAWGEHSIAKGFASDDGNIWFQRTEHTWGETKCIFCDAPRAIMDRGIDRENYAYAFIHASNIGERMTELFGAAMQFDVIIGNPPYQMKGGAGGSSDSSIYHLFVEQAKKLEPRYLSMVIPSRWLAGGRGLNEFRKVTLSSHKLLSLVDFPVSRDVFPNVEVKGGICYFLWSNTYNGPCDVTIIRGDDKTRSIRQLDEFDVFVRDARSASILRKVMAHEEQPIISILTADTPFGLATNFDDFEHSDTNHSSPPPNSITLYYARSGKRNVGFIPRSTITKNVDLIDQWKVLVPKAGSDGGQKIPDSVLGKPWLSPPPSAATQTFLAFWLASEDEAQSLKSYYCTKFFRHLVSLRKITQDALRPMYSWVPIQAWDRHWTDESLYAKYELTDEEIAFIESTIQPMDVGND